MNHSNDPGVSRVSRRGLVAAFAASAALAAPATAHAFSLFGSSRPARRLKMYSGRTGEAINIVYWANGEYIPEAEREVARFMRDWRTGEAVRIDRRTLDIIAATHRLLEVEEPYLMLSGYRSPATNAMLRRRSGAVARNSLHMKGQAADLSLRSRSVSQMASAAYACSAGGVGRYSRSHFVHMDCGPVRRWGY